jgi:signal transduction histidine kinase
MRLLSSLTNRTFAAMALLAVLSIAVAVYLVNVAVTAQAEAELQRGLEEAGSLVEGHRTALLDQFIREARLIADLPKLKAAVAEDDPPTVLPLAIDYWKQIDSDLFLVTNREGAVLATAGLPELMETPVRMEAAVSEARAGRETFSFLLHPGGILQVVSLPIWIDPAQPEILGTLSVGFSLDERIASRFKALTNSEIAFVMDGEVQATTLPPAHRRALTSPFDTSGPTRLVLGDDEYLAINRSLVTAAPGRPAAAGRFSPDALSTAASTGPSAIILRSRTERLRFLGALHTALAAIAIGAVFIAVLLSYGIARTVTRPLAAITDAMREMAATGDLTRRIDLPDAGIWQDEDTRLLASTFNTMTASIARFQREAGQRERLSVLGRLSTVVAHEIRNPLMIIKASVRSLRRAEVHPPHTRQAIEDIDEEVQRLNRLVSDVLDFARPITFDYAPADVSAICRSAVAAALVGEPVLEVRLAFDPALPPIVTDAERLRLALVNMLSNARQAVATRAAETTAPARSVAAAGRTGVATGSQPPEADAADIEVALRPAGDHRIAILIRDRGEGIAPEDLGRVFEPYFTTRRTGSGLGLAIARNIVEGLGGSIAISSAPAAGTEIRLELPLNPPGAPANIRS